MGYPFLSGFKYADIFNKEKYGYLTAKKQCFYSQYFVIKFFSGETKREANDSSSTKLPLTCVDAHVALYL